MRFNFPYCLFILLLPVRVFAVSVDNPHGPLPFNCNQCHTTEGWRDLKPILDFDHNAQTKFPLTGKHIQTSCVSCHSSLIFKDAGTECLDCHTDVHRGQFSQGCIECHSTESWIEPHKIKQMHDGTRFPLVGVHAMVDCQSCHGTGQFANLSIRCESCHLDDYLKTQNPPHPASGFSTNCEECHSVLEADWGGRGFVHPQTFPLVGGHQIANCGACHSEGFTNTPTQCFACHADDFAATTNPDHEAGGFPQDCEQCHTIFGWTPAQFDHNLTDFPLTGAHIQVNCAQCHTNGQFSGTPTDCYACHQADYENADDPDHVAAGFPQECLQCHTTDSWGDGNFNHDETGFPLTGAHIETNCMECHVGGVFAGTPTDCYSCHQEDYEDTDDPDHVAAGFSHNCAECHNTVDWDEGQFDHNQTEFTLTGAHIEATCAQCHTNGVFDGTPTDCYLCHQADYEQAVDPVHTGFPTTCAECHNTNNWDEGQFDHNQTNFPLTGAHLQTNCMQCHVGGVFEGTPTDCYACHQADYENAENPDHEAAEFPTTCAQCHTTDAWGDGQFNHSETGFILTGAHIEANCSECHIGGVFQGTPTDCYSCHQEDYDDADDPDHTGFPHDCAQCHNTNDWDEGNFNHSQTDFPLTGAHIQASCTQCHVGGQFEGTPTDCYACHQADFENAQNPDHEAAGFPTTCAQCHSTDAWGDGQFNHNETDFPLTGAHVQATCTQCHVGGQFEGTPTECFFCHQTDYDNTTDPDHQAAGFPTTCETCHTTANWNAQFNHDGLYFPIYSGRHEGEWSSCIECHTDPNDYSVFSCITCHEHNQEDMDDEHDEVGGYVYESNACLACHPDGDSGPRMKAPGNERRQQ